MPTRNGITFPFRKPLFKEPFSFRKYRRLCDDDYNFIYGWSCSIIKHTYIWSLHDAGESSSIPTDPMEMIIEAAVTAASERTSSPVSIESEASLQIVPHGDNYRCPVFCPHTENGRIMCYRRDYHQANGSHRFNCSRCNQHESTSEPISTET